MKGRKCRGLICFVAILTISAMGITGCTTGKQTRRMDSQTQEVLETTQEALKQAEAPQDMLSEVQNLHGRDGCRRQGRSGRTESKPLLSGNQNLF